MNTILAAFLAVGVVACGAPQSTPAPASQPAKPVASAQPASTPARARPDSSCDVFVAVRGTISDSFSPLHGEAALKAFVPEVTADLTTGECTLMRTSGSGATMVTAFFPARAHPLAQMSLAFDSAGHLIRFSERRGIPRMPPLTGLTPAQRDSTVRVNSTAIRSTDISLDFALDQAMIMNRGGGRPTDAVMGTVRSVESLPQLGPPTAHIERARRLCGV
jgi:hypothetical protein